MALRLLTRWRSKTSPGLIMRISLIISFLFHLVLLLTFQNAFSLYPDSEDLRTYVVELIRPPVEDMDRQDKADADIDKPKEEAKPLPKETQETISLDTDDKKYVTYARVIKERIMMHWSYPAEAKKNLVEGRLLVLFSLNREGDLTRLDITKSSGHGILDQEAATAIRNASPFPSFPEHITVSRLNVQASFDYYITTKRGVKKTEDRSQKTEGMME
jgi:TonB family protein